MRIVAITCGKNESDIVEAFVRHTLALCDRLVVLENGSSDETPAILQRLCEEGLALEIVEDPSPGYYQSQRMTRLMREFAAEKHAADWVLPLDADEFILAEPDALRGMLDAAEGVASVAWRTYVPDESNDPDELNPALRIRHRLEKEARPWTKVLVPGGLSKKDGVSIDQGSHGVSDADRRLRGKPLEGVGLAHLPVRSPGQWAAKILVGRLQYLAMQDKNPSWGFHYEKPFELLKNDPRAFAESYKEAAMRFAVAEGDDFEPGLVLDPIAYRGKELNYTPRIPDAERPLRAAIGYAEHLAVLLAES